MHKLSRCFLEELGNKIINNKNYYCLSIIFPTRERNYYMDRFRINLRI